MASAGIGADLEGVHAVAAALDAGRVELLTVEAGRAGRSPIAEILQRAEDLGVPVEIVDEVRGRTAVPQGIAAKARPIRTVSLDSLTAHPRPALVVLDHLEDPHNVGAIVRSAAAAGMTGLVVSGHRSAPLGPTAFKAAAGAFERVPVCTHSSIADVLSRLSKGDVWTVGLAADGPTSIFGLGLLASPVAIVIGAEGQGLGRLVKERCDVLAHIPMAEGVESLNASAAATLAMFEVMRLRS